MAWLAGGVMGQERREIWVGVMVIGALSMLFASTMRIGACETSKRAGMQVHAPFDNAAGVERRTDVLVAGVKVGGVEAVQLDAGRARVAIRIEDNAFTLPADSIVSIL